MMAVRAVAWLGAVVVHSLCTRSGLRIIRLVKSAKRSANQSAEIIDILLM